MYEFDWSKECPHDRDISKTRWSTIKDTVSMLLNRNNFRERDVWFCLWKQLITSIF